MKFRNIELHISVDVSSELSSLRKGNVLAVHEQEHLDGVLDALRKSGSDIAVVVDLTFATDQPGVELGPITKHPLESGPVIARGTSLHPLVFERLYEAAEAEDGALGQVDHGRKGVDLEHAEIGDRKRSTREVLVLRRATACRLD